VGPAGSIRRARANANSGRETLSRMRIHITGIPSAGKTTLAEALSERLGTPNYALDGLAFVDERWTLRPAGERAAMLDEILEEPSFITEGGFLGWTDDLLAAADLIIWLDPPLSVLVWRHVRRFGLHPWRLPSLLQFQVLSYLRSAGAGPAKDNANQTRSGIEAALKPWRSKVLRLKRAATATEVLAYMNRSGM
jgi:adenylate kinase family enzyme